jgi:hypothetical protein
MQHNFMITELPMLRAHMLVKGLSWLIASLIAAATLFYLLLLVINWQDEKPSADYLKLQSILQPPVGISANENGFAFFQQHAASNDLVLSPALAQLTRQCDATDCDALANAQPPVLDQLIEQHQPLLQFYQQLRQHQYWYEVPDSDMWQEQPRYSVLLDAQKLVLVQAFLAAKQQNVTTARQLLQQDLTFWRMVLQNNHSLLSKMVTVAAIRQHFEFAAQIRQQLAVALQPELLPESWLQPFTDEDLAITKMVAGESAFRCNSMQHMLNAPGAVEQPLSEVVLSALIKPMLQMQASCNLLAEQMLRFANAKSEPEFAWYSYLYNPVGKLLHLSTTEDYSAYRQRLLSSERLRQQTVQAPAAQS